MNLQSFKQNFKDGVCSVLEHTGAYRLTEQLYSGIGQILVFHRVCPLDTIKRNPVCAGLQVTPEYLEKALNFFISRDYEFISLDRLVCILRAGEAGKKFVAVTFDDGYADNLTYAYPIFKKYNIPFAIYVTTNFVDRKAVLWWFLLAELALAKDYVTFKIENKVFRFNCFSESEKRNFVLKIYSIILDSSEKNCMDNIKSIFGSYYNDLYEKTDKLMLKWEQINQLSADPLVTIGAHTVNHYALSKLSGQAAKYEILESKKIIEFHIKKEVRHLSYPFGGRAAAGKREFAMARECAFETAATNNIANVFFAHRDHLESLPRIEIGEDVDSQRLKFLMSGFVHCVHNRFKRLVTV